MARPLVGLLFVFVTLVGTQPIEAQETLQNGAIFGVVNDESGAPLPGVTIEVASPALQVTRNLTTEGNGSYRVTNLPPGMYRIAYSLTGFRTDIREGFVLPVGFTARVDVSLKIGTIEESIQVSGQAPIVDVSTSVASTTLTRTTLDALPTTRSIYQAVYLAPGVRPSNTADVGGSQLGNQQALVSYGVAGTMLPLLDGINTWQGGSSTGYFFDYDSLEEVQVRATGSDADVAVPGTSMITVMKSGGNQFHGSAKAAGEWEGLQASNVSEELGALAGNPLVYFYDTFGDLGGRLIRDKWWFYAGWHIQRRQPKVIGYLGKDGQQGYDPLYQPNQEIKTTFQLTQNTRIIGLYARMGKYQYERAGSRFVPWGSTYDFWFPGHATKGEIVWSPTSNILVDVLAGLYHQVYRYDHQKEAIVAGNPWTVDIVTRQVTGPMINTGSADAGNHSRAQSTGSVSIFPTTPFLGGKHGLQVGYLLYPPQWDSRRYHENPFGQYQLQFNTINGVPHQPYQILAYNTPLNATGREIAFGLFMKDNWQIGNRMTLNLGVRFDRYHVYHNEETQPAGPFTGGGTFPKQDIAIWKKVVPRLGVAYDVSGSGRTVVRASYGQYGYDPTAIFDLDHNPAALVTTTYRWSGPCVVTPHTTCDAAPATLASLTPSSPNFVNVSGGSAAVVNPDLKQPTVHTTTAGLEHELMRNFAVRGMYVYNRLVDQYAQVNIRRPYSAFTIPVVRTDPQAGNAITLYTYPAALAGSAFVANQYQNTDRADFFHAIEFTATKRKSNRWMALASLALTKSHRWLTSGNTSTANPQSPNQDFFPIDETWDRSFKASATYDLVYAINLGAVFHSVLGTPSYRTVQFTGVPQLGTVTVPVEPFGTQRNPTVNMLNLRAGRAFRTGLSRRLELSMDVFNVLNSNAPITVSYQTGPTFRVVNAITPPLIARLNASYTF